MHKFQTLCAGVTLLKCPTCQTSCAGVGLLKEHMAVCHAAAPPLSRPSKLSRSNKSAKNAVSARSSLKGMFCYLFNAVFICSSCFQALFFLLHILLIIEVYICLSLVFVAIFTFNVDVYVKNFVLFLRQGSGSSGPNQRPLLQCCTRA